MATSLRLVWPRTSEGFAVSCSALGARTVRPVFDLRPADEAAAGGGTWWSRGASWERSSRMRRGT
eukprot:3341097-Prymnesium_polylepis.1